MTLILVVGDSRAGKTTFAHLACHHRRPLNVFRSTCTETFYLRGNCSVAELRVVPGDVTNEHLIHDAHGVDGVIVLYDTSHTIHSASRWLLRLSRLVVGLHRVPLLVCCHKSTALSSHHDRRLSELLIRYKTAEHTCTSEERPIGIVDCVNRMVTRVRRLPPSPLAQRNAAKCSELND